MIIFNTFLTFPDITPIFMMFGNPYKIETTGQNDNTILQLEKKMIDANIQFFCFSLSSITHNQANLIL